MVAVSYHIKQSFTISEWGSYFPIEPRSKAPKLEIKYPGTDSAGPKKHWMTRRFRVVYTYYYSSPGGTHGRYFIICGAGDHHPGSYFLYSLLTMFETYPRFY